MTPPGWGGGIPLAGKEMEGEGGDGFRETARWPGPFRPVKCSKGKKGFVAAVWALDCHAFRPHHKEGSTQKTHTPSWFGINAPSPSSPKDTSPKLACLKL